MATTQVRTPGSFFFTVAKSVPALPVGIWPFCLVTLLYTVPTRLGYPKKRLCLVV